MFFANIKSMSLSGGPFLDVNRDYAARYLLMRLAYALRISLTRRIRIILRFSRPTIYGDSMDPPHAVKSSVWDFHDWARLGSASVQN